MIAYAGHESGRREVIGLDVGEAEIESGLAGEGSMRGVDPPPTRLWADPRAMAGRADVAGARAAAARSVAIVSNPCTGRLRDRDDRNAELLCRRWTPQKRRSCRAFEAWWWDGRSGAPRTRTWNRRF